MYTLNSQHHLIFRHHISNCFILVSFLLILTHTYLVLCEKFDIHMGKYGKSGKKVVKQVHFFEHYTISKDHCLYLHFRCDLLSSFFLLLFVHFTVRRSQEQFLLKDCEMPSVDNGIFFFAKHKKGFPYLGHG